MKRTLMTRSLHVGNRLYRAGRRALIITAEYLSDVSTPERNSLLRAYHERGVPLAVNFDYEGLRERTLRYVASLRTGEYTYRYSASCSVATLYSSVYACMTRDLYGDLDSLSGSEREGWARFFDGFQSAQDGLFRDPAVACPAFETEDWWGARHLATHMIVAYTALGRRPSFEFRFLRPFCEPQRLERWLETRDWQRRVAFVSNEIMNLGVMLQYARDAFEDASAGAAVALLLDWLESRIDRASGLWCPVRDPSPRQRSHLVQAAYHLYPLFLYDGRELPGREGFIDNLLATQNRLGGFGVELNSSACEDIDSIEPLVRLSASTDYRQRDVRHALGRGLAWSLANMNEDGGFVFRRNHPLVYGHPLMSSRTNESGLFPTWFRTLALAYLGAALGLKQQYTLRRVPGMQFSVEMQAS